MIRKTEIPRGLTSFLREMAKRLQQENGVTLYDLDGDIDALKEAADIIEQLDAERGQLHRENEEMKSAITGSVPIVASPTHRCVDDSGDNVGYGHTREID